MSDFLPIPPTNAIADPQTRAVLDAIAHNVRTSPSVFLAQKDASDVAAQAVIDVLGGGLPGSATSNGAFIDRLAGVISRSALFNLLGERVDVFMGASEELAAFEASVRRAISETQAVAAQLTVESRSRVLAIQAESQARATALLNEATARGAAITVEQTARETADTSLANQITTLTASVNTNAAAIQTEATTRADADTAEATLRTTLAARVGTAESNITAVQQVNQDQATSLTNLTTRTSTAESNITSLQTTTANQATSITSLSTSIGQKARIFAQTAAPTSNASYTLAVNDLWYDTGDTLKSYRWSGTAWVSASDTRIAANESSITTLNTTTASQATSLTNLTTRVGTAETSITSLNTTTDNQATSLSSLNTRVGTAESGISSLDTTTSGQATSISNLTTRMGTAESGISSLNTTTSTQASSITSLTTRVGTAESAITTDNTARSNGDNFLAAAINNMWAKMGGSTAAISDTTLANVTPSTAAATKWDSVVSAVTDPNTGAINSASIVQEFDTYANNANGKFNSSYTVRAQTSVGGKTVVGGFGLMATAGADSAAGSTIDFGVRADKFFIASTTETPSLTDQLDSIDRTIPFIVTTVEQTIGGVTYPPGVYIKKAVIADATITTATIENAAITSLKIGDDQVTIPRTFSHGSPAEGTATIDYDMVYTLTSAGRVLVFISLILQNDFGNGVGTNIHLQVAAPSGSGYGSAYAVSQSAGRPVAFHWSSNALAAQTMTFRLTLSTTSGTWAAGGLPNSIQVAVLGAMR